MDDFKLIKLVREHKCLYDSKDQHYKDTLIRDNVWKEISEGMEQTPEECKKRWGNIRDTFRRHKNKRKLPTGSSTAQKVRKWHLEGYLEFLNLVETERESVTNTQTTDIGTEKTVEDDLQDDRIAEENEGIDAEENLLKETVEKKKVTRISGNKRKTCDPIPEQVQKNSKERQALFLKAVEKREPEHPVDIFFKSMAGTLKNLSAERQVKAKMQMSQIVWQMELEECASRMGRELLTQGAEGRVYNATWLGRSVVVKQRFPKQYRHPDLDAQITRDRIKAEARALTRCRSFGIKTPAVYDVDFTTNEIVLEKISDSITIRNYIYDAVKRKVPMDSQDLMSLAEKIGEVLAKLHTNNLIHGDLTTSNMLLVPPYNMSDVILIDFGLSSVEERAEDKAVDLYVLERAILSTHPNTEALVQHILSTYKSSGGKVASDVIQRLDEVRLRGRKKLCFG